MSATIATARVARRVHPLAKPYALSFATLTEFVAYELTLVLADGRTQTAEVVPLPGYSEEGEEAVAAYLNDACGWLPGLDLDAARTWAAAALPGRPFAASPVLTAIDLFHWPAYGVDPDLSGLAFVHPTSTADPAAMVAAATADPARTVKIKLTGKPDRDVDALRRLEELDPDGLSPLRLDANQAFDLDGATAVMAHIAASPLAARVAYMEQPLPATDWDGHRALIAAVPDVAVMLDESVVTTTDVDRARAIGAGLVKLKLFKQGGIAELRTQLDHAAGLGLGVVLGNGVATMTSNRIEIALYREAGAKVTPPCEANGFRKVAAG